MGKLFRTITVSAPTNSAPAFDYKIRYADAREWSDRENGKRVITGELGKPAFFADIYGSTGEPVLDAAGNPVLF